MKQTSVLDGAEWLSVRKRLSLEKSTNDNDDSLLYKNTVFGVFAAVSGSINGKRVAGMQVLKTANKNITTDKKAEGRTMDNDVITSGSRSRYLQRIIGRNTG